MTFVSMTRLHLRSIRFFPQMGWSIFRIVRQTTRSPGFIEGKLLRDANNTFWTLTAWTDAKAMRAYRGAAAHKQAMSHLANWCDEASLVHWDQDETTLPTWEDAYERLLTTGRASPVDHPTARHTANRYPAPEKITVTRELPLRPKTVPSS